ncbi:MAG: arabinofuranosidase catalytic domain-containing protein [Acidobacteriota bacterium]
MITKNNLGFVFALTLVLLGAAVGPARAAGGSNATPNRPKGPCDVYAAAGDPCVAAHSTTRALYASYNGPLYQVMRQSDGKKLDIGVVQPSAEPVVDPGGYADAAAQDRFCANTYCWITTIYDQSGKHNDLTQAPRGGFSGPALGGFNNLPLADMAPATVMGHKVYGVLIEPGMGLRNDNPKGTAVDDQAEGQYWVINGLHFNDGCCFDYGNAEIDSRDDDNGTMETAYFGDAPWWYHGDAPGPWIMTDQENNLVGCVNADGSNECPTLPNITWRFVTAVAKGEPHHWTSMGGNAQDGALRVMFDGPRVNATYDPMRKQGAILLGNGGDNSNGSQGTFYEGAVTAAGTFPSDATDQQVQANVVAAGYAAMPLSVAPARQTATPPGLQTFSPHTSQQTTVTFTNTTGAPVKNLALSLKVPEHWSAAVDGGSEQAKNFPDPIQPGASAAATFNVTAGAADFNGDIVGQATWTGGSGAKQSAHFAEKVRSGSPVKINEFRIGSGANSTDSFIELYNAGEASVDLSHWSLTLHPTQQAIFSAIEVPAGTQLKAHGFYLLGLSNSGLAIPARTGDKVIHIRSTGGMSAGDTITIGSGGDAETRKIAQIGSPASNHTTVWQPLPEGPVITIPAGSTNVPVMSTAGFKVGEKIALGYGATYPDVGRNREKYEVATVTAVGKPGAQEYLAVDAPAGSTNLQVTSTNDISAGDTIRLDIDSMGHGIETVTVTHVGTPAGRTNLAADASAGASKIMVRNPRGFAAGGKITIGTPATREVVTVTAVGRGGPGGAEVEFTPALAKSHIRDEWVVAPGTGVELAAPLKFNHAANLPFSDRGTGISFAPATAFAHSSNEPVQALGTGITLDRPLSNNHAIDAVVRDSAVTGAGYQGAPKPDQWFGGPELITYSPLFGRTIPVREGSMVLRDAAGTVIDSLNYGGQVDPWAAEGYEGKSGRGESGCHAPAPGQVVGFGPAATATDASAGRYPDGADSDSNCADFHTQATAMVAADSSAGDTNLKVSSVQGFEAGQKIVIGAGADRDSAVIGTVGTAGATTLRMASAANATAIAVANVFEFHEGQTVTVDSGAQAETAVIASIRRFGPAELIFTAPLARAHQAGAQVSGSGITLSNPLAHAHAKGTQVADHLPSPGAANDYSGTPR